MNESNSIIIEFDIPKKAAKPIALEQAASAMQNQMILWIHCDLHDKPFLEKISGIITIPETVTSYINEHSKIPRLDESQESLAMKIQAPMELPTDKKTHQEFGTFIVYLTEKYCVTFSRRPIPAIQEFKQNYKKSLRFAKTPCFILFIMIDNILNKYAQILYAFESISDTLDFSSRTSHKHHYRSVMKIKKDMIKTKRHVSSIRDMLMRISGRKISVVSEECRKALIDTYNHSQAIVAETDSVREILNGILDQIDNSLMHKMSQTMTLLTAFATIFMPPTLIASLYGMNFDFMPELHWKYGYYFALALMLGSGVLLYVMFKRKRWF